MNMFEEARSIKATMKLSGMTQEKLASVMGVSQPYIANKLRLLNLSQRVQERITDSKLSERHARVLLRLYNEEEQLESIKKIIEGKMSVARTEIMIDSILDKKIYEKQFSNMLNTAERIGSFEKALESSLSLLREFGIRAKSKREEYEDKIYINIAIG